MDIKEKVHINQRPLKNGGYALHLDYRVGGKRIREFLKLYLVPQKSTTDKIKNEETMRIAIELKNRRIRDLDSGELGIRLPEKIKVTLAEDWLRKKISTIKAKNSRDNNLTMLKNLLEFKKNVTLTEIDRNFFKGFIDFLTTKGLSTNTIRLYGILLKARMHEAYIDGKIVKRQDFFGIIPKKKPNEIHFLTLEELQTLFATNAPEKIKNPFMFCCFTGLRFSDLKALKWEDIDNGIIVKRMKKTGEIVRIPLSENALRFMPKRGAKANLVFDLGPLNTFSRKLKEWANEAGITKNIHFHMSRHSFATLALSNGADLYTVSKLLGHREVTTTQVYAKVLDEGRKKAVDAIPDLLTEHNQLTPANQETL